LRKSVELIQTILSIAGASEQNLMRIVLGEDLAVSRTENGIVTCIDEFTYREQVCTHTRDVQNTVHIFILVKGGDALTNYGQS
jgi:hypothetical protein